MTAKEQMIKQFHLLTDWYTSVLEDIRPEDGRYVLSAHTNSLEWLAGHLLVSRYRNIGRLGGQAEPPCHLTAFVDPTLPPPSFRPFDRSRVYPSLAECQPEWAAYATLFHQALAADEQTLQLPLALQGPTGGNTVEDFLTSVVLHEAFHIGQMSMIRKALGYKAMYWFRRPGKQETAQAVR